MASIINMCKTVLSNGYESVPILCVDGYEPSHPSEHNPNQLHCIDLPKSITSGVGVIDENSSSRKLCLHHEHEGLLHICGRSEHMTAMMRMLPREPSRDEFLIRILVRCRTKNRIEN